MSEIDKDLVRWTRGKWFGVVVFLLCLHVALILLGSPQSQTAQKARVNYPKEPTVALAGNRSKPPDWSDVDNPFLFAGAEMQGFSGDAWLRKPEWKAPETGKGVAPRFLTFAQGKSAAPPERESEPFVFAQRRKQGASLPEPRQAEPTTSKPERRSELHVEGLAERRLVKELNVPAQIHTDILSNSVVEALVSADGLVISARLVENSGSAKADADALALARGARFSPAEPDRTAELGKLIFQWHGLDLSQTNRSESRESRSNNVSNSVVRPR